MSPDDRAVDELERQLERGSLFTHTALGRGAGKLREIEVYLYGLADALIRSNAITTDELTEAIAAVREELDQAADVFEPGVALRVDGDDTETQTPVAIDCDARMSICQAVCCKLDFALNAEEIERGVIRWDLGRPYMVRHAASGYCVHNDKSTRRCDAYDERPRVCRTYSCANDSRIWKDFDAMELNAEWLDEHVIGQTRPFLLQGMLTADAR